MHNRPVTIPPNRQWTQENRGNVFGSLYGTRNIDLTEPAVLKLSQRMSVLAKGDDTLPNFEDVQSIVYGDFGGTTSSGPNGEGYYIITSEGIFLLSPDLESIGELSNANTPDCDRDSDAVSWLGNLMVTTNGGNLSELSSGTWTNSLLNLTNGVAHPLAVSSVNNFLLIGNGNELEQRDDVGTNTTEITIPPNFEIRWIRSENQITYFGTSTNDNSDAKVFEWDEVASSWTFNYPVDANWILSGEFILSDFFILSNDGRLMQFNGGGFEKVAEFPIYESLEGTWKNNYTNAQVVQRGMRSIGGRLNINIDTSASIGDGPDIYYDNFPSGIWEYQPGVGLYHKFGLTGSSDDTDFLRQDISRAGAISPIYIDPTSSGSDIDPDVGGKLIAGARLFGVGTDPYYLLSVTNGVNRGSFTTTRIDTPIIADNSMKLWEKYQGVDTSDEKILFKYRYEQRADLPFSTTTDSTYTSTTTFTTTDTAWDNAQVGDEVTILSGNGAGCTAHITQIDIDTPSAGTDTITLDEAILGVSASETASMLCDNWTKIDKTAVSGDNRGYTDVPSNQERPGKWTQWKTELRGNATIKIEDLLYVDADHIQADS